MSVMLVTGCAGFIGSHVADELLNQGHRVVGLDNFDDYYPKEHKLKNLEILRNHRNRKNFTFIEGSILDKSVIERIKSMDVSVVNHHAAIAGTRNSIKNPVKYFETNLLGTVQLLDAFRDVEKFVFISSSSVYGELGKNELPVREDAKKAPISPYALSKLQAEEYCNLFRKLYGTNTINIRLFTVYGPRQRPDEAMSLFIDAMLSNKKITIYGDGEQTRDFTFIKDAVAANLLAIERGSGTYNIGSGTNTSVNSLVRILAGIVGRQPQIEYIEKQPGDVRHTWADITKAREELSYEPRFTLEQGLAEQLEWFRNQNL